MAYISTDAMWYSNGTMHDHQTSLPAPVRTGSELSLEVRYGGDLIIGTLSNGPLKLSVFLEILTTRILVKKRKKIFFPKYGYGFHLIRPTLIYL